MLQETETPKVYYSSNLDDDIALLKSRYYQVLGFCSYNGPADDEIANNITKFCKEKRAKIGLYGTTYTHTNYGVYNTGTNVSSYNVRRYDYTVVLFVGKPKYYIKNQKTGFEVKDLDISSRKQYQRNTGVIVDVVYEDSNAFYANLIKNDIIIKVNQTDILDSYSYNLAISYLFKDDTIKLTIIRNGIEKEIKYKL